MRHLIIYNLSQHIDQGANSNKYKPLRKLTRAMNPPMPSWPSSIVRWKQCASRCEYQKAPWKTSSATPRESLLGPCRRDCWPKPFSSFSLRQGLYHQGRSSPCTPQPGWTMEVDPASPLPCPIRARTHASCGFRTPRRLPCLRDVAFIGFLRAKNQQHHPKSSQSIEHHQNHTEKYRHGQFHGVVCLR